jgi:hypothetical protein
METVQDLLHALVKSCWDNYTFPITKSYSDQIIFN